MPLTDYIPDKVIREAGYIRHDDTAEILKALAFDPRLSNVKMEVQRISEFLGVGRGRVTRYLKVKGWGTHMTLKDVLMTDWSELTDINPGDGKRKKTFFKFD